MWYRWFGFRATRSGRRSVAIVLVASFIYSIFLSSMGLVADPRFREFQERGRPETEKYINRANRLTEEQSWTNYVETGVAHEQALWEAEALEEIRKELRQQEESEVNKADREANRDRYYADFEAARLKWEEQASDYIEKERGGFKARLAVQEFKEQTAATEAERIKSFTDLVDEAKAATAATASLDLALWDSVVDPERASLATTFLGGMNTTLDGIRTSQGPMSAKEQAAFESELDRLEGEIKRTYETQENFYLLIGRNQYIAVHRVNDLSLRYEADANSATAIANAVIDTATEQATAQSEELLNTLESGMTEGMNNGTSEAVLVDQWEKQIEAMIESGLYRWQQAEEELYGKRLEWMNASKRSREETEAIWKKNHDELKKQREAWLKQVQQKIETGRTAWEGKIQAFYESRESAEKELAKFIEEEKSRRDSTLSQLGDMVKGGGAALAQAKESYRFFKRMSEEAPDGPAGSPERKLKDFYIKQRDEMAQTIAQFQSMLATAENRLDGNMNSDDVSSGLLKDRRLYAGDLRADLADLSESDFEDELRAELGNDANWEKYLLYRRDLSDMITSNAVFVDRATELKGTTFNPRSESITTIAELRRRVSLLDARYDEHRNEILRIIDRPRGETDETTVLEAIREEIDDWFELSTNRDVRLKSRVLAYFDDAYAGYYLSENDNDPYLMTRAEYEWELLRRERDYMADRYERAAEVKRYADLAEQYDAALEVASVTKERAEVAHARELLIETGYLLLKGDLEHGTSEEGFAALLQSRGVNLASMAKAADALDEEKELLDEIADYGASDVTADTISDLRQRITVYITEYHGGERHRLAILGDRLFALLSTDGEQREGGLSQIKKTAGMIAGEVISLQAEYRSTEFLSEKDEVFEIYKDPSLTEILRDMTDSQSALAANAALLAGARQRLDAAKEQYGQAYTDYQILSGADPESLVELELKNAASELSALLNGMKDVAEAKAPETQLEEKYGEYYRMLADQEQAAIDLAYTEEVLSVLAAAEAAKERRATLDGLLPGLASSLNSADPVVRADAILSHPELVVRTGETASYGIVIQAVDNLTYAKAQWQSLGTQLATEEAKSERNEALIEKLKSERSRMADLIDRSIELVIDGIRGEAKVRQDLLVSYLNGADAPDLSDELAQSQKELTEEAIRIGKEASADLVGFLEANRGKSFAELLAAANSLVSYSRRNVNTTTVSDYAGYIDPSQANRQYEVASILRDWILSNESYFSYVNTAPTSANPLSKEERWDDLIEYVQAQNDLAVKGSSLRSDLPLSADDARIVAYRSGREDLLGRVDNVLSSSDAGLRTAYLSLTPEDRELLMRYGVQSIASAADLRRGLNRAGQAMRVELATLDTTYQSVYLRELAVSAQRQASIDERALVEVSRDLEATRLSLRRLQRERDAILDDGQTPSSGLLDEISRLEDLESDLRTSQVAKETALRQSQAILSELQSPGSSVVFAPSALSSLSVERSRQMIVAQLLNGIQQKEALESGEFKDTATDELKAMIGFYETDANGKILRTDDGKGIVSDQFASLGFDATSSLDEVLAGGRNAAQLEGWARNIISYLKDADRSARTSRAVRAAAAKLESSLIELAAARAFIEKGWNWDSANNRWAVGSDTIAEDARADEDRYAKLQMKLALFAQFEASLKEAMTTAEANQGNVSAAALAIIEKPENAYIFRLFDGYNEKGEVDGIFDDTMKGRVLQLSLTVDRLRRQQSDAAIYAMAENYGVYLSNALGQYGSTGGLVAADPDAYLDELDSLDPAAVKAKVGSVGDTDFEKNIRKALDSLPASAYLYRSHLLSIVEKSPLQGAELKAQLLSAIDGYEADMLSSLEALTGESFGSFRMQADLELKAEVDEKVSLFIERYMNRGSTAKSELTTIFDDLAAELSTGTLDDRKNVLRVEILDRLKDAVFTSMVRDLLVMIENGEDLDSLKQSLQSYANGLVDPTEAQVFTAKESILMRTLRSMLALGDSLDTFEAKLIPEEFREFVMLRQYERAEKRYADYQTLKNSDVESERESAVLDLRGIEADFAASVLLRDFSQWQSTHSIEEYLSQAKSARSIQDYLGEYMQDRNTASGLLPRGGADIVKLVMQQEYSRLTAAGSVSGIDALDERAFFSDFTGRICMERVKKHATESGFTLTGVVADDETAYRTIYDAMLSDAKYAHDGLSFRERLVGDDAVETFFDAAFAFLIQQPSVEMYDPSVIRMLRSSGELVEAITAESVLPDEWTQYRTDHPGYANLENRNYRTVLKEIAAGFGLPELYQELARIETSEDAARRAGLGYLSLSLTGMSDADLDRAITLAGYADLSGTQSLRDDVKRFLIVQAASQSQASLQDLMRQESLMNFHYGTEAERDALEIFLTSEGEKAAHIEEVFFSKLEKADSRLRELAKNDRGGFFYHLIYAGDTDFVVPGDLSTPFANLKTAFLDTLTEKEKTSLATHAAAYKKYFAMRSSQELITSGIFEKIDAEIFGNLAGSEMTDAKITEARSHRSALMVGLMRSVGLDNPTAAGVAANLPDSVPADLRDDVAQTIARTLQDLDPAFLKTLRKETTLLERFITRYLEADALRNDLADFLKGEADLTDFGTMHAERRALAQEGLAEAQYGLLSHIDADRRALENLATDYGMRRAVASRLASFAALRGANVSQSRFVNYRTYADDASGLFEADYRKYLANVFENDSYLDPEFYTLGGAIPATDKDGNVVQTYEEFRQGMLLETEDALDATEGAVVAADLPAMFADGSFVTRLVSDRMRSDYDSIVLDKNTADTADDSLVEQRTVQRITFNRDASGEEQVRQAYHAHLANHYLEALSDLNESLRGLALAASKVDANTGAEDRLKAQLAKAQSGDFAALRTAFETARTTALTLISDSGQTAQDEAKSDIDGLEEALGKAEDQFGAAARRKHLKVLGQTLFVEQVFNPIAAEFEAARDTYDTLTTEAGDVQDAYSTAIGKYTKHLDDMSAWWRRLESAQGDAQRRLAVKDYAETPYLFSASMTEEARLDALKDYATDAREEYRRAGLLMEQANAQLKAAGFNVQIDTNIEKFDRVLSALNNVDPAVSAAVKVPLTEEERKKLSELRDLVYRQYRFLSIEDARQARNSDIKDEDIDRLEELENREIYEQYGELIAARADYIKHTMRMIRLQKAQTLVQAEIQRLEMETAEKKQRFEDSLAHHFGDFSNTADEAKREEATNARNAVYQRLAAQYEAGAGNYFGELSAWYWKSGDWLRSIGQQSMKQAPQITPSQVIIAAAGMLIGGAIPQEDAASIGEWLSHKSGSVFSSFSGFSNLYYGMILAAGQRDLAMLERDIVNMIWTPVIAAAYAAIAVAKAAAFATFGGSLAAIPPLMAVVRQGTSQMSAAAAKVLIANILLTIGAANTLKAAGAEKLGIGEVVERQRTYEASKAKLEYFTKIPDMETLKERLQKYGELQDDPDPELAHSLYSLTEEDLRYLVEMDEEGNITSVDSDGGSQELTEEEKSELYDAKASQGEAEYTDSFGRKYDRDQIVRAGDPAYPYLKRDGGVYQFKPPKIYDEELQKYVEAPVTDPFLQSLLGKKYTRIPVADHHGNISYVLALLDDSVDDKAVYHAGNILRSLVDHGNILRNDRVQEYLGAGQAQTGSHDWSFILAERDRTMKDLFTEAADNETDAEGGREYAGYTMVYADYEANQQAVFDLELQQRVNVQKKEWDLREQELLDRRQEWESRVNAMLKAGKRSWTDAEDRYLSEWRAWERDFDRKIEDGNKEWDERIAKHMADREQWEVDLKKKASEAASEAALTEVVGGFNTQLQTLASNAGISMTPISLTDAIERAKSEIMANLPTQADQLANINESIERFNTNLSLSEMWGTDTQSALAGLSTDFRNEMGNFQKQMVVYANAKILEQYQKLMSDLLEQIDRQNRAIEQQTEMAALGAGFVRSGNVYIKQSKLVSSAVGMVEAYQWFDGKAAFDGFLSSMGDGYGGALFRNSKGEMVEKSRDDIMSDLPAFLETADTVQVESFFSVQKLILQKAFEKIMGTGTAAERKNSKDKDVIGELAWWIGKPAGSSEFVSQVEQAAPHLGAEEQKKLGMDGSITAIDGFKYLADPGFGELGSGGNRPSSIYLGFYNKLDLVSRYVDGKDSERMERIQGSVDPISATINQFNPVVMLATAIQNVRVASEVYGKDAGYMWEAQLVGAVKGALPTIGAAIGSLAGPAGTAIGSAIGSALASTIHVDTKTGKRDYQTTDQTGISLAIAAATWGASAGAQYLSASEGVKELIGLTSAAVSGGMKYDENGRLQGGFDVTGASISAVSSYAGNNGGGAFGGGKLGSFLASDITSTILNTGVQYHNYSHGYENSYAALANPDLTRLGALGGGLGVAAYNDKKAREFIGWARDAGHSEEAIINGLNTLGYSEFAEQLQNELAKQTDQAYRVGMSAAGLMRRKEEEEAGIPPVSDRDMVSILNGEAGEPIQRSDWGDDTYRLPDGRIVTVSERDTLLFLQKQSLTKGELMNANAPAAKKTIDHEARWIRSGDRMVYNGKEIQHYHAGDSIIPADVMDKLPPAFQEQVRMMDRAYHEGGAWLDDGYYTWNEGGKYFEQIDEIGNHVTIRYENGIRIKNVISIGSKGVSVDVRSSSYMNEKGAWINIPYRIVKVKNENTTLENTIIDSQGQALLKSGALNLRNYTYPDAIKPITNAGNARITSDFGPRNLIIPFHSGIDLPGTEFTTPLDGVMVPGQTTTGLARSNGKGVWRQRDGSIMTFNSKNKVVPLSAADPVLWAKLKLKPQQLSMAGNMLVLQTQVGDQSYFMQFMHLKELPAARTFQAGERVGMIGSTGASTGPHAHFGVYTNVRPDVLHRVLLNPRGGSSYFVNPMYFLNYMASPYMIKKPK